MVAENDRVVIRRAETADIPAVVEMAMRLWDGHTAEELSALFQEAAACGESAVWLAVADGRTAGFAQGQLRHDYVEGTASCPVGYLEAVYVRDEYRKQGIARQLVRACEEWAKENGCVEFASDCELENRTSLAFHLNIGFEEANRIICFVKKI